MADSPERSDQTPDQTPPPEAKPTGPVESTGDTPPATTGDTPPAKKTPAKKAPAKKAAAKKAPAKKAPAKKPPAPAGPVGNGTRQVSEGAKQVAAQAKSTVDTARPAPMPAPTAADGSGGMLVPVGVAALLSLLTLLLIRRLLRRDGA